MSARGEEALLALLHAVPPLVGTWWFQTLGAEGLPGGRAPWLVLLYGVPPAIVGAIAALGERGVRAARLYGVAIFVLAAGFAWHPPVAMDGRGWARILASVALASAAALVILANRVARHGPAPVTTEGPPA